MSHNSESDIIGYDKDHVLHPFTEFSEFSRAGSRLFSAAEGVYITGPTGQQYLDGIGGLWCVNAGYGRSEIISAIARQASTLPYYNTFTDMTSEPAAELAKKIAELAPGDLNHVFFTTGGSDSNDSAIRLAHFYFQSQGKPQKRKIISRVDAYHGSTYLAASLSGIKANHAGFHTLSTGSDPLVHYLSSPNVYRRPAAKTESEFCEDLVEEFETLVAQLGAGNIACFIAEPIMGAGGVIVAPRGYHARMQEVCKENDILYVSDEVVTAFGRLGHWFASRDLFGIQPDIVTVAKGISSGYLPLGAMIYSDRIHAVINSPDSSLGVFSHGFTYSGHPVCCAAGLANIELIEREELLAHVQQWGPYFEEQLAILKAFPIVGDVRGSHFMMAIEFVTDKEKKVNFPRGVKIGKRVAHNCFLAGLIARNVGDYIILSPPLIINKDQIDWLVKTLSNAILAAMSDLTHEGVFLVL